MTDDELRGALDGLYAYDSGSTDSGVHDEVLRQRCIAEMRQRMAAGAPVWRLFLSRTVRIMWLCEEALREGYGIEDAMSFMAWLDERMEIQV